MRTSRAAFSLTEIMVGVAIMAIVIFPVLHVILSETKVVTGTREHSQAAFLGQRILETARTYNFAKLDAFVTEYSGKEFNVNETKYKVEGMDLVNIQTTDPTPVDDKDKIAAKRLKFSIKYTTRDNNHLSLDLATIIARHE